MIMSKKNNLIVLKELSNIKHNNSYNYDNIVNYKNMHELQNIICPTHGVFKVSFHSHITKGRGCKECAVDRRRDNKEVFVVKSNLTHNNIYDYSLVSYKNTKTVVDIICPTHGVFKQKPNYHIQGSGCPICKESKGEREVRILLESLNVKYETQKKFDGCKYTYHLKFDFFLPEYNICIEYDGEQHTKIVDYFGGEDGYNKRLLKDNIKNNYCKDNGILLLRFNQSNINDLSSIIENTINK